MRALITGGRGFIGANLIEGLSEQGFDVRSLDIVESAAAGTEFIVGDIRDVALCKAACTDVDVVFHAAAIHQIEDVASGPIDTLNVNVGGSLNMLRAAVDQGVRKFVFLSSAKVYGKSLALPSLETEIPQPVEVYALSKLTVEHYCRTFVDNSTMDITVIRPFSVYGPGQSLDTGYVGMVIEALLTGRPLILPGGPEYARDFVHVDDVIRLCCEAATGSLRGLNTLNIGSGHTHTLAELVELIGSISGDAIVAQYREPRPETLVRTHADMTSAEKLLGFSPQVEFGQGLEQTIDWFRRANATGATAQS